MTQPSLEDLLGILEASAYGDAQQQNNMPPLGAIEVTQAASCFLWGADLHLSEEVFRSLVTRRPGATVDNLTLDEKARLYDLIAHASPVRSDCQEGMAVFDHMAQSSGVSAARNHLLQMWRTSDGYAIDYDGASPAVL